MQNQGILVQSHPELRASENARRETIPMRGLLRRVRHPGRDLRQRHRFEIGWGYHPVPVTLYGDNSTGLADSRTYRGRQRTANRVKVWQWLKNQNLIPILNFIAP